MGDLPGSKALQQEISNLQASLEQLKMNRVLEKTGEASSPSIHYPAE